MKFKILRQFCLVTGILFSNVFHAQSKVLTIGDSVPEINLKDIINYPTKSANISDFKDKLLILDFWATWCSPCVHALPEIDSFQKYFGDKIEILPVTAEDAKTVSDFLEKIGKRINSKTTSVTNANYLKQYFPHYILPHCVWIYKGVVKAITEGSELTKENIQKLLEENELNVRKKDDGQRRIDRSKPFFNISYHAKYISNDSSVAIPFDVSKVKFYSIITNDYTENENGFGYPNGLPYSEATHTGITAGNLTIKSLFLYAFGEFKGKFLWENRIVLETTDTSLLNTHLKGLKAVDWMNQGHSYSYELKVPPELFKDRFKIMQNDLNKYFGAALGIIGDIEKRERPCLVLQIINNSTNFTTNGGKPEIEDSQFELKLKNVDFGWLISLLRKHKFNITKEAYYSIVDDTNLGDPKVDLELNANLSDLNEVNKELEKYGLKFIKQDRVIDVVVIKDK